MRLNWGSPVTWMVAGALIMVIGLFIGERSDMGESVNPVGVVGGLFFLLGAFTAAIRYGMKKRD